MAKISITKVLNFAAKQAKEAEYNRVITENNNRKEIERANKEVNALNNLLRERAKEVDIKNIEISSLRVIIKEQEDKIFRLETNKIGLTKEEIRDLDDGSL